MIQRRWFGIALIPVAATAVAWISVRAWLQTPPVEAALPPPPLPVGALDIQIPLAPPVPAPFRTTDVRVARGASLSQLLKDFGMLKDERAALMDSLRPFADPARLTAGTPIKAIYQNPEDEIPGKVEIHVAPTRTLVATRHGVDDWTMEERAADVERRVVAFSGVVDSTLWSSATDAGMDPTLITRLTEVFAWQFDFNRQVQEDDHWRLTVERLFVDGTPIGFGDIIAAEYANDTESYSAVRYVGEGGRVQYFTPTGDSLQALFLKSPLRYGHITSGFSAKRFHPILKINRPHLGVDYGAPTGTPVLAVGDGTVTVAAFKGQSGKMISLRHAGTYSTEYKHLSGFAKGIAPGAKVGMGQVIGYVGMTGLATGPHLHYEFHIGNKVVDPQGVRFPAADRVPSAQQAAFEKAAAKALAELPPWSHGVIAEAVRRDSTIAE